MSDRPADPFEDMDPAGSLAERKQRGARSMAKMPGNPFFSADVHEDEDPFAPLPPGAGSDRAKDDPEVWEWNASPPAAPPEPSKVSFPGWGPAVARWLYHDAAGVVIFATYRFEGKKADGSAKKDVLPYSYGHRNWTIKTGPNKGSRKDKTGWHFHRPCLPVPLYNLQHLAARPDAPVVICEGEKSADAAAILFPDYVAICSQGGSDSGDKADWGPLAGRAVTVWPDHDPAGLKYASAVVLGCQNASAASIGIVTIPDAWPDKWDVADERPPGVTDAVLQDMLAKAEPAQMQSEDAADRDAARAATLDRLVGLSSIDYAIERKEAALILGIGVVTLDQLVKAEKARRRQEAQAADRQRDPPAAGEVRWPFGFAMKQDGLYVDMGESGLAWVCAPFRVLGEARDSASDNWGLWLQWADRDGRMHTWAMPKRLLMVGPGELEAALVERGLGVATDPALRNLLRQALGGVLSGDRVLLVPRTGWLPDGAERGYSYVLSDGEVIGSSTEHLVLQNADASGHHGEAGTLESWQADVAALAQGNVLPVFAMSIAFAPPLLDVLQEASGGVHIYGKSKEGKTLASGCGVSVWARPKKGAGMRDWRATANGMEGAAEASNDGLLALDEMHQAEPREVVGAIYMLCNESGKERLNRDTTSRKKKTWRVVIVSNGELDIQSVVAKAAQAMPAGAEVRLPSVPITPGGMWTDFHDHADAPALMRALYQGIGRNYGTAGRAFLHALVEERVTEGDGGVVEAFAKMRERFLKLLPPGSDLQVQDVARRFALFALAGEMAIAWEILPWVPSACFNACAYMLKAWLARRGGGAATEEMQQVRAIRSFLIANGASRFVDIYKNEHGTWLERHPERPVINRAGWVRDAGGRSEYLIHPDIWKEVCIRTGLDPADTAKTLHRTNLLTPGEGKNLARKCTVPRHGKLRCFVISPDILGRSSEMRSVEEPKP